MGALKKSVKAASKKTAATKSEFEERMVGGLMRKVNKKTGEIVETLEQMGVLTSLSRCECNPDEDCTCGKRVLMDYK